MATVAPMMRATSQTQSLSCFVKAYNILNRCSSATTLKLKTSRTIGGVSFDGSANINLPGVNTTGNQDTTGNAATASKLQTSRSISLSGDVTGSASFDGSGNITIATTAATQPLC